MNVRRNCRRAAIAIAAAFVASLLGNAAVTVDNGLSSAEALEPPPSAQTSRTPLWPTTSTL